MHWQVRYITKTSLYFSKPSSSHEDIKIELDFLNYATKSDVEKARKKDLADLKSDVCKLDNDKLKSFPTDLINL